MQDVETLWADFTRPIVTADDYFASLRGRRMNVFFMGERVPEPVDHPVIRPSDQRHGRNLPDRDRAARARQRPHRDRRRATSTASCTCRRARAISSPSTRCSASSGGAPAPAFSAASASTPSAPAIPSRSTSTPRRGTDYHKRFLAFLRRAQIANVVIGGAMTDPKGDRSKPPHQQDDLDLFLHVVRRDENGIYVSGRQDAPDRRGQLALADLHADHAHDRGRPRLGGGRRRARRRAGAHLHRRPADQRHAGGRRRRARCRQRAIRRPGIADRVRGRVRAP